MKPFYSSVCCIAQTASLALFILLVGASQAFSRTEDIEEVQIHLSIKPNYIQTLSAMKVSKLKVEAMVTIGFTWEGVGPGRCIKGGDDQGRHSLEKIIQLDQGQTEASFDFKLVDYLAANKNSTPVTHYEYREVVVGLYSVDENGQESSIDHRYRYGYNGILTNVHKHRGYRPDNSLLSRMVSLYSIDGSGFSGYGASKLSLDIEVSGSTMETHDDYSSVIPALVYDYYFRDRVRLP